VKKFISGLIIGMMITSAMTGFAVSKIKNAYFNPAVNLRIDGKGINTEIITVIKDGQVNGSNYVSARALAEAMGGTVTWIGGISTISIYSKGMLTTPTPTPVPSDILFSELYPAPLSIMQTFTNPDPMQKYTIQAKVTQIIRGPEAWDKIRAANSLNKEAADGYEYILTKIYFKVLDMSADQFNLSASAFTLVSSDGKDYGIDYSVLPEPQIAAQLYKDTSNEGWVVYQVKKGDFKPKLVFGRKPDGSGGIWFKAY
jgi:hypothetical protein